MSSQDTLQAVATEIGKALLPLQTAVSSTDAFVAFMAGLGWDLSAALPASFQNLISDLGVLAEKLENLIAGEEVGVDDFEQITNAVRSVISDIEKLKDAADLPSDLIAADFQNIFSRQLMDSLILNYLISITP